MPDGETRCSLITVAIRRVFLGRPLHNGRHQLLVHDDAVLDQKALDVTRVEIVAAERAVDTHEVGHHFATAIDEQGGHAGRLKVSR